MTTPTSKQLKAAEKHASSLWYKFDDVTGRINEPWLIEYMKKLNELSGISG